MTPSWSWVEWTAHLLDGDQRDAVLGDLREAGESAIRSVFEILGLVMRREAALWLSWRPWLSAFGVSLPASFLLMGYSLSVSQMGQRLLTADHPPAAGLTSLLLLLAQASLLTGWAWSGGYLVGRVSRKTIWLSAFVCCSPCLFCLSRFHVPSLSRFCLLVFLLPAVVGVLQSLRNRPLKLSPTITFTLVLTVLTILAGSGPGQRWSSPRPWILDAALSWPSWCLVAMASRQENS